MLPRTIARTSPLNRHCSRDNAKIALSKSRLDEVKKEEGREKSAVLHPPTNPLSRFRPSPSSPLLVQIVDKRRKLLLCRRQTEKL